MNVLRVLLPHLVLFLSTLVLSLALTPLVRELCRRLGMVDRPGGRRINVAPIPRGGGMAIFLSVAAVFTVFVLVVGDVMDAGDTGRWWKLLTLAGGISLLGLADDRWSLPPLVKLLGQLAVAFLVWFWGGLGFCQLWPALPAGADCALTVFWIVGAVNAFNLIDGLDGLASGIAFIGVVGMAGALALSGNFGLTVFHAAFAGALLGFLRYNYNPASVFLGDSGSMLIGFTLACMPLIFRVPHSLVVSVVVPLLAMGVPIFDTFLAILRRSLRRALNLRSGLADAGGKVMTADSDHLHHRILRSVGFSQRKAAWMLYVASIVLVGVGLADLAVSARRAGLWLAAVTVASVVIFKDMARVELFDAGRLLNGFAHESDLRRRRRLHRLAVPFLLLFDLAVLGASFYLMTRVISKPIDVRTLTVVVPIRVFATFCCLVFFRTYRTVWARAMLSNYLRLLLACVLGSVLGTFALYFAPAVSLDRLVQTTFFYAVMPFLGMVAVRVMRPLVRDVFYALDCGRLVTRKDVSRVLVYGAGLRYKAFRRELVRTTSENRRIIVGLLDDDVLLRRQYIGGIQVKGTLADAAEVIVRLNVDAVVVACRLDAAQRRAVAEALAPTGVKVSYFDFSETEMQ